MTIIVSLFPLIINSRSFLTRKGAVDECLPIAIHPRRTLAPSCFPLSFSAFLLCTLPVYPPYSPAECAIAGGPLSMEGRKSPISWKAESWRFLLFCRLLAVLLFSSPSFPVPGSPSLHSLRRLPSLLNAVPFWSDAHPSPSIPPIVFILLDAVLSLIVCMILVCTLLTKTATFSSCGLLISPRRSA